MFAIITMTISSNDEDIKDSDAHIYAKNYGIDKLFNEKINKTKYCYEFNLDFNVFIFETEKDRNTAVSLINKTKSKNTYFKLLTNKEYKLYFTPISNKNKISKLIDKFEKNENVHNTSKLYQLISDIVCEGDIESLN